MARQTATRDDNRVTSLIGVDSATFTDPTTAAVDPTTHEVLVKASLNGDVEIGAVEIKDATTDTRAKVQSDGVVNALVGMESSYNIKKTIVGQVTYVALAPPGTVQSSAAWQAFKKDESTANQVLVTWADGDALFNNVATDLTVLTYS